MSRRGDQGPYEVGNVFINLSEVNVAAGSRGLKRTPEQNAARSQWMRGNINGTGLRWVSKDGASRSVKLERVPGLVEAGWALGRVAIAKGPEK